MAVSHPAASAPSLGHTFAVDVPELVLAMELQPVADPQLLVLDHDLATELGLDTDWLRSSAGVAMLAGNEVPPGVAPVAMIYAGHQFGGYSPRLGDGRALLLGELTDESGNRVDVHLKGSGRTPLARGGDGRGAVGPMLREYLFAAAMDALGVPTGRALAVVGTGETIRRDAMVPGAVLTRVASSHLRVGTFEYAVRLPDQEVLRRLADHAIARHHPAAAEHDDPYLALLDEVVGVQASLVAQWMLIGFVHGVLNTDNTTISGETIDYGPCAFMDAYDPATVFSSIDHAGRYAYGNQPAIVLWNLARLAETLIPLVRGDDDESIAAVTEVLEAFDERYRRAWVDGMGAKLGLSSPSPGDEALFGDLLDLLHAHRVDYTTTFRALAASLRGDDEPLTALFGGSGAPDRWVGRWQAALAERSLDPAAAADAMDAVNPVYVPRNHLVEHALAAAVDGDLVPFEELLAVLRRPYEAGPGLERFAEPAPASFNDTFQTFCGT